MPTNYEKMDDLPQCKNEKSRFSHHHPLWEGVLNEKIWDFDWLSRRAQKGSANFLWYICAVPLVVNIHIHGWCSISLHLGLAYPEKLLLWKSATRSFCSCTLQEKLHVFCRFHLFFAVPLFLVVLRVKKRFYNIIFLLGVFCTHFGCFRLILAQKTNFSGPWWHVVQTSAILECGQTR